MKYTHDNYLQLSNSDILSAYKIAFGWPRVPYKTVFRIRKFFENEKQEVGGWSTFYAELDKYIDELKQDATNSPVNHPTHYGGEDNPHEAIKVIEAWDLGFNLGNVVKYLSRAGKKGNTLEDLRKAAWYLNREIQNRENE
jgi:hypothetical protein